MCPVCGKTAQGRNRRQNMDNHMLTHTGERPFQCTLCTYRASQHGNLKRHIRAVHKPNLEESNSNSLSMSSHFSELGLGLTHHSQLTVGTPQVRPGQNFDAGVQNMSHTSSEQPTSSHTSHEVDEDDPPFGLHLRLKAETEPSAPSCSEASL